MWYIVVAQQGIRYLVSLNGVIDSRWHFQVMLMVLKKQADNMYNLYIFAGNIGDQRLCLDSSTSAQFGGKLRGRTLRGRIVASVSNDILMIY